MTHPRPGYDRRPTVVLPESELIRLHSPLDILTKIAYFLQERFRTVDLGKGVWSPEDNSSGFLITTYLSEQEEVKDAPLKLCIDRGTIAYSRVSLGNLDQNQDNNRTRDIQEFYSAGQCVLRIECQASQAGTAEILGDIVQSAIHMTREGLKQQFLWRDISEVALQPCRAKEVGSAQNRVFVTNVEFIIHYELRWASTHADPPAREVIASAKSPEDIDYAQLLVRRSSELPDP